MFRKLVFGITVQSHEDLSVVLNPSIKFRSQGHRPAPMKRPHQVMILVGGPGVSHVMPAANSTVWDCDMVLNMLANRRHR